MSHLSSSTGTPVTKGKAMRVRRPEAKRVNYVFALHYPSSSSCSERAGGRARSQKHTIAAAAAAATASCDREIDLRKEEGKNANKNGSLWQGEEGRKASTRQRGADADGQRRAWRGRVRPQRIAFNGNAILPPNICSSEFDRAANRSSPRVSVSFDPRSE